MNSKLFFTTSILILFLEGCYSASSQSSISQPVIIGKPAQVPNGVLRYCWEEPIVKAEHVGPGLDLDGHWYRPDHTQVREVRMGRWRPCVDQQKR